MDKEMKSIKRAGVGSLIAFYAISLLLLFVYAALLLPSADIVVERGGRWQALVPLLLLSLLWLYTFWRARTLLLSQRYLQAYAWLLGGNALGIVLMLNYLTMLS
jgi:hypothetical protein